MFRHLVPSSSFAYHLCVSGVSGYVSIMDTALAVLRTRTHAYSRLYTSETRINLLYFVASSE